jgi:hypothetical protein
MINAPFVPLTAADALPPAQSTQSIASHPILLQRIDKSSLFLTGTMQNEPLALTLSPSE